MGVMAESTIIPSVVTTPEWIALIAARGIEIGETTRLLLDDEVFDAAAAFALDDLIRLGNLDAELHKYAEQLLSAGGFGRSTPIATESLAESAA